jgi:transcription antitermination factor NusG
VIENYWSVAQTYPLCEDKAINHLRRQSFEVYLPKVVSPSSNRLVPLFRGYVFVVVAEQWHRIMSTIGVLRLLLSGDSPARLPTDFIDALRSVETDGGTIELPPRFRVGDQVRVRGGHFKDLVGLYAGIAPHASERVLMNILGGWVPVVIKGSDLELAL